MGRLFANFSRVDSERNKAVQVTGLGLAITRALRRLMGGEVTVESEYGRGSVFLVEPQRGAPDGARLGSLTARAWAP